MPEYGKPIYNNLHWKSTLDFFKEEMEKQENVGGEGLSEQGETFDTSRHLPKPSVTGPDHPEGAGIPLRRGFTAKEWKQMRDDDDKGVWSPSYPQDSDSKIEESLLKLMKVDDQRLNAMSDDKVKEHDEENILVADGDKTGDAMKRIAKEQYPGGMGEDEWEDVEREYRMGQNEGPRAEGTVRGTPQQLEEEPISTQRSAKGAKVTGVPADVMDNPLTYEESHKLHGPNVEELKNSLLKLMDDGPFLDKADEEGTPPTPQRYGRNPQQKFDPSTGEQLAPFPLPDKTYEEYNALSNHHQEEFLRWMGDEPSNSNAKMMMKPQPNLQQVINNISPEEFQQRLDHFRLGHQLFPDKDIPGIGRRGSSLGAEHRIKRQGHYRDYFLPSKEEGSVENSLLKIMKEEGERTPEEEKEIYVQRQINRRNAPGEHMNPQLGEIASRVQKLPPGTSPRPHGSPRNERMSEIGEIVTSTPGIKTTRPLNAETILPPEEGESKEDWIARTFPENPLENSLFKLMTGEYGDDDGGDDTPLPFYHPDNPNHNGTTPGSWPWYQPPGDAKGNAIGRGQQKNDILQNQFDRFAAETGTESPQIPKYKLGQNVTADHHPHSDFKEWHDNDWAQAEEHQPQPTKDDKIEELEHKIGMYSRMRNARLPLDHPESTRGKFEDPNGPKLSKWTKKEEAAHQQEIAEHKAEIERLRGSEDAFKREFPELSVEKALLKLMKREPSKWKPMPEVPGREGEMGVAHLKGEEHQGSLSALEGGHEGKDYLRMPEVPGKDMAYASGTGKKPPLKLDMSPKEMRAMAGAMRDTIRYDEQVDKYPEHRALRNANMEKEGTVEEGGGEEQIHRLRGTEEYKAPFTVEYRQATPEDAADDIETLETESGPMHVVQHRGPELDAPNIQNNIEKALLKLMKAEEDEKKPPTVRIRYPGGGDAEGRKAEIPHPEGGTEEVWDYDAPSYAEFRQPKEGEEPTGILAVPDSEGNPFPLRVVQHGTDQYDSDHVQNSIEKSLLKLMKADEKENGEGTGYQWRHGTIGGETPDPAEATPPPYHPAHKDNLWLSRIRRQPENMQEPKTYTPRHQQPRLTSYQHHLGRHPDLGDAEQDPTYVAGHMDDEWPHIGEASGGATGQHKGTTSQDSRTREQQDQQEIDPGVSPEKQKRLEELFGSIKSPDQKDEIEELARMFADEELGGHPPELWRTKPMGRTDLDPSMQEALRGRKGPGSGVQNSIEKALLRLMKQDESIASDDDEENRRFEEEMAKIYADVKARKEEDRAKTFQTDRRDYEPMPPNVQALAGGINVPKEPIGSEYEMLEQKPQDTELHDELLNTVQKLMKYGDINPTDVGMTRKNALEMDKAGPPTLPKVQSNLPQQAPTMSAAEIESQSKPQEASQAGVGEAVGAITDFLSGRAKQSAWQQQMTANQMKLNPEAVAGGAGDYSQNPQQQPPQDAQTKPVY